MQSGGDAQRGADFAHDIRFLVGRATDIHPRKEEDMVKHAARLVVLSLTLWGVAAVMAQAPAGPPQPGLEHKKLGSLIGKWKDDADTKPSSFGPGGKYYSMESCDWYAGGFFMVCHAEVGGALGEGKGLSIFGCNTQEKVYTYYGINSWGEVESAKGTVSGDTWTWHSESKIGGKAVQGRFSYKELSPDSATMKYEVSTDGGPWSLAFEAKRTRAK